MNIIHNNQYRYLITPSDNQTWQWKIPHVYMHCPFKCNVNDKCPIYIDVYLFVGDFPASHDCTYIYNYILIYNMYIYHFSCLDAPFPGNFTMALASQADHSKVDLPHPRAGTGTVPLSPAGGFGWLKSIGFGGKIPIFGWWIVGEHVLLVGGFEFLMVKSCNVCWRLISAGKRCSKKVSLLPYFYG
jgi:hypothetical protein